MDTKWISLFIVPAVVLLMFFHEVQPLSCYKCVGTTHDGTANMCDKLSSLKKSERQKYVVQCATNTTFCRKIFHEIGYKTRSVYQCGMTGVDGCVRRAGTKNLITHYCHCKGDLCNAAPRVMPALGVVLAAVVVLLSRVLC